MWNTMSHTTTVQPQSLKCENCYQNGFLIWDSGVNISGIFHRKLNKLFSVPLMLLMYYMGPIQSIICSLSVIKTISSRMFLPPFLISLAPSEVLQQIIF